jgi:hypothetical protein
VLTVFFSGCLAAPGWREIAEIDRSIAIVVEAARNLNRANFPLKSKRKILTDWQSDLDRQQKTFA